MFLSVYKSAREVDMEAILPAFPVYLPGTVNQYYVFLSCFKEQRPIGSVDLEEEGGDLNGGDDRRKGVTERRVD